MKPILLTSLAVMILFSSAVNSSEVGRSGEHCAPVANTGVHVIRLLRCIQPVYPTRAVMRGIEGWAQVSFTITREGRVQDVTLVEEEPAGYFEQASVRAAMRFRFTPIVVDGEAIEIPDARYTFYFPPQEAL